MQKFSALTAIAHFDIHLARQKDAKRLIDEERSELNAATSSEEDSVVALPRKKITNPFLQNTRKTPMVGDDEAVTQFYGYIFEDNEVSLPQRSRRHARVCLN